MRFGIVGDPVDHSRSPAIHNAAFAAVGIDATYVFLPTPADAFPTVIERLRSGDLAGVNVTMPHKALAYEAVDARSENAELTGSVNTIVLRDGRLFGTNTDVFGVEHALGLTNVDERVPLLVLGSGGAAAAAVVAAGDRPVFVSARTEGAGRRLLDRTGSTGSVVPWGEGVPRAVVINATPLGMHGETLPEGVLDGCAAFVDMTYGATEAPSVAHVRTRGIPFADGIDMLVGQAFEAFTIFTGLPAPREAIEQAARNPSPSV